VPERRPANAQQRHRRRSTESTHEFASVLREINTALTVPLTERDERWEARVLVLRARKDALIAEIQATAAGQAVGPDPCTPPGSPGTGTSGPEVGQ